ncbi:helix-turn-helix domain-containing protein [Kineosporia babensis]|uniref:Helix-turn-helix domain-containing protein n=1 Tax=Kineosporia babensis TaxID=499548 RepID=A0A9X1SXZ6_9ACTN|nr:helix-turn-helix transcriptional regulator [Kineosporia babensis]MCD5316722.1 helix-turn-helix domain-containing protein [Kineosporia babensis]
MPGTRPNPTASRRVLAAQLRRLRLAAGKSTEDAARELMASSSKISRLESGERTPQARDVRDLARFYGATDDDIEHMQLLVSEARRKGWWADYSTEEEQGENYLGLESAASSMDVFENLRWPGLLQTEAVTRALLKDIRLPGALPLGFIDDQVVLRRKRQERMLSGELSAHFILDEGVFHRPLGVDVVDAQARHVLDIANDLPNVTLQIVALRRGSYPGLDGSFLILQYPKESGLEDIAFSEGLHGMLLMERPSVVDKYRKVFSGIASEYALPPGESLDWLRGFL